MFGGKNLRELVIDVKRTGFPVKLAGIEFFFDCSVEAVEKYQMKQTKIQNLLDSVDSKEKGFDENFSYLEEAYDVLLEEGAFKKLYKKVPDFFAWIDAYWVLVEGINDRIDQFLKDQEETFQTIADEYLSKE